MNNVSEIEEIALDESTIEDILPMLNTRYKFPSVTITDYSIYWNKYCIPYIKSDRVKFKISPEYLIILPATAQDTKAFSIRPSNYTGLITTIPRELINRKALKKGSYKAYKYKDGLAIRCYELLEDRNDG